MFGRGGRRTRQRIYSLSLRWLDWKFIKLPLLISSVVFMVGNVLKSRSQANNIYEISVGYRLYYRYLDIIYSQGKIIKFKKKTLVTSDISSNIILQAIRKRWTSNSKRLI